MPCCHLCHKTFTVASLSGHLKKCHLFNNVSERKHILNLCNKRTNIRRCPCPVPGCGSKGQFLERHMGHVHKELRYDQVDIFKDLARRRETDRLLQELRDTNPEIPLTTTWEDNKDLVMDPTRFATQPARRDRPCHNPGCQVLQQRFLALQKNWRKLKAELQKAKRELWAFQRPSGALGLPEAEGNRMRTIPVPMSFDQCVESRLQVKMNSPDSSRDISIKQEPEDHPHLDQCVESRLQVKMNSPDSSRNISIKQEEPEDHPHLEVSPKQESSPSLLQEEPEPPHIKDEPAGLTLTLAVESEDGDEDISSHCFEVETEVTEDSDDWDETSGGQSASNTSSVTRKSSFSSTNAGEKPFRCTLCNKCFSRSAGLKRHQRFTHTGTKPFHCPFCGKGFRNVAELERHQRVHTGEKPFCCTMCDKCFTSSRSLINHKRIHSGETPYQCTHCGKSSNVLGNLKTHCVFSGHAVENPFHCKHCDKSFTLTVCGGTVVQSVVLLSPHS